MVKVFAALGEPLRPIENFATLFAPETSVYSRVGLIMTPALGGEVATTLGNRRAVIMRGHGSTVVGPNLKQATIAAIYLEETARLTYRARSIGKPICFNQDEVEMLSNYVLKENSFDRAWAYYDARLPSR
jgi:ribulose-5-phosphate 4-epimerase/fuculose-1-phosphate aldolase